MTLLTFAGMAALLTMAPGPDSLLVVRTAVVHGRRAALTAALGVQAGCLWWGAAAGVGLAAVLAASHVLYAGVRWAGAAYLLYLGVRLLVPKGVRSGERPGTGRRRAGGAPEPPGGAWFLRGLLTNALNPKVGVFYLSLLPQFVPAGAPVLVWSLLLAGVHVAEGIAWCALLVVTADRLGDRLRRPAVQRLADRVAGVAFVGFAARLVLRP